MVYKKYNNTFYIKHVCEIKLFTMDLLNLMSRASNPSVQSHQSSIYY